MGFYYKGIKYHDSMDSMTFAERARHYGKAFALRFALDSAYNRLWWALVITKGFPNWPLYILDCLVDLAHLGTMDDTQAPLFPYEITLHKVTLTTILHKLKRRFSTT